MAQTADQNWELQGTISCLVSNFYKNSPMQKLDYILSSHQCVIISPANKNLDGAWDQTNIASWSPKQHERLHTTISSIMQQKHQEYTDSRKSDIVHTFSDLPIFYISCQDIPENCNILLYILQTILSDSQNHETAKETILETVDTSLVWEYILANLERLHTLSDANQWFQEFIKLYNEGVTMLTQNNTKENIQQRVISLDWNWYCEVISELLWQSKQTLVYIDNTTNLSYFNTQLINKILFTRGSINNILLYCKINNWWKHWKTYKTPEDKLIQSPHDYHSEYIISDNI